MARKKSFKTSASGAQRLGGALLVFEQRRGVAWRFGDMFGGSELGIMFVGFQKTLTFSGFNGIHPF